ncbi:FMN-binding protein [Alkaliphilus pronyensis]|uniref:FMN-binding protein n=1 Tax=Alkaliphilus pronyensis TaxID=1482732 RepID=A0A6I0FIS8_9FIRM|nr:FMN-binding protein [Alkaliphilus pronyensis]KAB3536041.1 FMN-binding protein [Alkaliphilus pronyensis]
MKKLFKILGIIFATMLALMVVDMIILNSMGLLEESPEIVVNDVDLSQVSDGAYTGECDAGLVKVSVVVEVKDNKITDITIERHQNGLGGKAEKVIDSILEKQSLNVDVISGATVSSNAISKAVENALTVN